MPIVKKYSDVPKHFRSGYLWRWLRGGVWLRSFYGWTRATNAEPERLESVLWLGNRPLWHAEDHRRPRGITTQGTT